MLEHAQCEPPMVEHGQCKHPLCWTGFPAAHHQPFSRGHVVQYTEVSELLEGPSDSQPDKTLHVTFWMFPKAVTSYFENRCPDTSKTMPSLTSYDSFSLAFQLPNFSLSFFRSCTPRPPSPLNILSTSVVQRSQRGKQSSFIYLPASLIIDHVGHEEMFSTDRSRSCCDMMTA